MRPSNESLTTDYMRDLESDIRSNGEEIANGRTDLLAYDAKCRAELAALRAAQEAGTTIGVDRYGVPSVAAGQAAEIEAARLILAVIGAR